MEGVASKKDYSDTLVVRYSSGNNKNAAVELAGLAGGKTASLPDGEKAPQDADILIILGE